MANCATIATFAAVLPKGSTASGLSASQAGWIGGVYFGGYAAAVPILASLTDRIDGRWVLAASSLLGAAASLVFGVGTEGSGRRSSFASSAAPRSPACIFPGRAGDPRGADTGAWTKPAPSGIACDAGWPAPGSARPSGAGADPRCARVSMPSAF